MCFAPHRRALFRHLNFQKWSDPGVFCTFWLGNVLRAITACNFSSLIWPDGSAPAALASLPFPAPGSSFFWDFLFVDLLSSSLLFSDSSHLLNFLRYTIYTENRHVLTAIDGSITILWLTIYHCYQHFTAGSSLTTLNFPSILRNGGGFILLITLLADCNRAVES